TLECNSVSLLAKRTRQSSVSLETDVLLRTIREAREAAGLSQREVGKRIGFHPTMYHKIEIGARVLDTVEFVVLARALGVDPLELFGRFLINLQKSRVEPET
ncbi:MAG: helix-turn-helix domain-containing protein, partial [Nitrospiraceae bacterium]